MCGRTVFSLDRNLEKMLRWQFQTDQIDPAHLSPGHRVPVLMHNPAGELGLASCRWEFEPETAQYYNARLENVKRVPMWTGPFTTSRGLLPAQSFWERNGHFAAADGSTLFLGAMYKFSPVRMVTMLTMPAVEPVVSFHHRMPVIIPENFIDEWCAPTDDIRALQQLVLSCPPPPLRTIHAAAA